jgi:predicted dehydrogenase
MARLWNRRQALQRLGMSGIAATGLVGVRTSTRAGNLNDRLNLAVIGCGGRGAKNLNQVSAENIVALCDVDQKRASEAFEQFPKAKQFQDYRRLLDAMQNQIDAVVISVPDHMHAPISLAAMNLDKHVYCEKPLAWSIGEVRQMAKVARQKNLATQMGIQHMARDGSRKGIDVIRSGALGEVTELHVWTDRAGRWWPQGVDRPADRPAAPEGLKWDLWLGVAPARPYHPAYCPFVWRGWKDFGTGAVGDMGIHNVAMPFAALDLGPPASVEIIATSGLKPETFPAWSRLKLEIPARHRQGLISLFWYDGGQKPSADLVGGRRLADNGAIVIGPKGTLFSDESTDGVWMLLPEDRFRDFRPAKSFVPRAPGQSHHQEWLRAARGGPPAFCRFDGFAARLAETMLVANLALRTGQKIAWNAETLEAEGYPEAAPFIKRDYRTGW